MNPTSPVRPPRPALAAALLLGSGCVTGPVPPSAARTPDGDPLRVAFYAFFEPVSHSADEDPASPGVGAHLSYEEDLLTALEAMDEARLSFQRTPVSDWLGIWILLSTPNIDIAGGGITILESRTRNEAGEVAVAFNSGHIAFRQSLLVRAADAERFRRTTG